MTTPSPSFATGSQSPGPVAADTTPDTSEARASAPQLTEEDFQQHKVDPCKIILRASSEGEREAQATLRDSVKEDLQHFCEKVEAVDPAILRNQWEIAVYTYSKLDGALLNFFDSLDYKLKIKLREEALEDPSLLEWGRAFLKAHFQVGVFLQYDDFIAKIREVMYNSGRQSGLAVLRTSDAALQHLRSNNRNVDESYLRHMYSLEDRRLGVYGTLHFVCGDSGSGKTHFAVNALSQIAINKYTCLVAFYIDIDDVLKHSLYGELCQAHKDAVQARAVSKEDAQEAYQKRNRIAAEILKDLLDKAMMPYRLKGDPYSALSNPRPQAFIVVDDVHRSPPMLCSLTFTGDESTVRLLNRSYFYYQSPFWTIYIIVSSSLVSTDLRGGIKAGPRTIIFHMKPSIQLLHSSLSKLELTNLYTHWTSNSFFFFVMCNRSCASELLKTVECNQGAFLLLNRSVITVGRLLQMNPITEKQQAKWCKEVREVKRALLQVRINLCDGVPHTLPLEPFAALSSTFNESEILDKAMEAFSYIQLLLLRISLSKYKQCDDLKSLTATQYIELVRRGTFLSLCGASHEPANCQYNDKVYQVDASVSAGITSKAVNYLTFELKRITHRICLHHVVMAMVSDWELKDETCSEPNLAQLFSVKCESNKLFFFNLFSFLCDVLCEGKAERNDLTLFHILDQLRWPESSAKPIGAEALVRQAITEASLGMASVTRRTSQVAYPFISGGKNCIATAEEISMRENEALEAFCAGLSESNSNVYMVLNGEGSQYADMVVVCGDVLLLISVIGESAYGGDEKNVRETTAKLGFKVGEGEDTAARDFPVQVTATNKLAKRLGCRFAVSVFALLKEPHATLAKNLPHVDVSVPGALDPMLSSLSSMRMRPLVLYVAPYLEYEAECRHCECILQ